jgi:hypothetical protein
MTIDRYTKIVLTAIAGALLWIAAQNSIGTAHAGKEITKVAICDFDHPAKCAEVSNYIGGQQIGPGKLSVTQ